MSNQKVLRRLRIRRRIRKKISGTEQKPRMSVFRSNKQIYVQLIDDVNGNTLLAASTQELETNGTKKMQSREVGKLIAKKAAEQGIDSVVFDRSGYLYHGRVKELADGAREAGLQF